MPDQGDTGQLLNAHHAEQCAVHLVTPERDSRSNRASEVEARYVRLMPAIDRNNTPSRQRFCRPSRRALPSAARCWWSSRSDGQRDSRRQGCSPIWGAERRGRAPTRSPAADAIPQRAAARPTQLRAATEACKVAPAGNHKRDVEGHATCVHPRDITTTVNVRAMATLQSCANRKTRR